jgi:hypothetical protein
MIIKAEDYRIECIEASKAVIAGILRLPTPSAYEAHFKPIKEHLKNASDPILDLTKVDFMNSSGITALGKLVLFAKENDFAITILGSKDIPWQTKSLKMLEKLWNKVCVTLS